MQPLRTLAVLLAAVFLLLPAGGPAAALPTLKGSGALAWLAAYGAPTLLGMALFATLGAALGYGAVKLGWRLRIWFKRRHRSGRAA